jgi:hypothetical protein
MGSTKRIVMKARNEGLYFSLLGSFFYLEWESFHKQRVHREVQ